MKRILSILIILSLVLGLSSCAKAENGGITVLEKEGIKATFDPETGTLRVRGSGAIENFYGNQEETGIKKIIIEEGIEGIWNSFNGLLKLKEIEFPSTLVEISGSFQEIKGMKKLDIPASVLTIEDSFQNCTGLKKLQLDGAISITNSFNNIAISALRIPERSQLERAFNQCEKLKKLEFDGVIIAFDAFNDCAVKKLYFPAQTEMENVFNRCGKIKEIVVGPHASFRQYLTTANVDPFTVEDSDDMDWVVNFEFSGNHPKIYLCLPKGEFDHSMEEYKLIEVPEGENWKDYRK